MNDLKMLCIKGFLFLVLLPLLHARNTPSGYGYAQALPAEGYNSVQSDVYFKDINHHSEDSYYIPAVDGEPIVLPDSYHYSYGNYNPMQSDDFTSSPELLQPEDSGTFPENDISELEGTEDLSFLLDERSSKGNENSKSEKPKKQKGTKLPDVKPTEKINSSTVKYYSSNEVAPVDFTATVADTTETTLLAESDDHDCNCDDDDDDDDEDDVFKEKDVDVERLQKEFLETIDQKFRSLVFNPAAQAQDKFQACVTPLNETGNCRYVQHCLIPSVISSIDKFMNYVCIINDRFVGICCPEHPVTLVNVKWEDNANDTVEGPIQKQEECGASSKKRIVGGSKSDPKDWPWMAALLTMKSGQFYCGGSLINDRYVLTAAHCTFRIPQDQILVRLGEYDFSVHDKHSPGEDFPVVQIKRHGQYSRRTLRNDIALLKLGRPVKFNKNIGTICLPSNSSFVGETATLAGWGNVQGGGPSSNVLLEAAFPVVQNGVCSSDHGIQVPDSFICTKSEDSKGACNGDSGGPLMRINELEHWEVIGVVSWGRRGCDPKFPTVYSRTSYFLDWINAHAT